MTLEHTLTLASVTAAADLQRLDYEDVQEVGGGSRMGYHLLGHYDIDTAQAWLALHLDEWGDRYQAGAWWVSTRWCRKVPATDDDGFPAMRYAYTGAPGPGAYPVTVIESPWGWDHVCERHPDLIARSGLPEHMLTDAGIDLPEGQDCMYLCPECCTEVRAAHDAAVAERMAAYRAREATPA